MMSLGQKNETPPPEKKEQKQEDTLNKVRFTLYFAYKI